MNAELVSFHLTNANFLGMGWQGGFRHVAMRNLGELDSLRVSFPKRVLLQQDVVAYASVPKVG